MKKMKNKILMARVEDFDKRGNMLKIELTKEVKKLFKKDSVLLIFLTNERELKKSEDWQNFQNEISQNVDYVG